MNSKQGSCNDIHTCANVNELEATKATEFYEPEIRQITYKGIEIGLTVDLTTGLEART